MKNATRFSRLLQELSREPRLKRAIIRARRRSSKSRSHLENLADLGVLLSTVAAQFMKKKKARALRQQTDVVHFLVQVSLLLKENVFARPEVREFFTRSARRIDRAARATLGASKAKKRGSRPARVSR